MHVVNRSVIVIKLGEQPKQKNWLMCIYDNNWNQAAKQTHLLISINITDIQHNCQINAYTTFYN